MKILKLLASNIKKLKIINIEPDSNLVKITGKNGSGKSSTLDCILYAMGGKDVIPSNPIHKGEMKGDIQLILGQSNEDGYEVAVHRTFNSSGTTKLNVVEAVPTGRSPQKILDDLMGKLSFDPQEFNRMKPPQQLETLRGMVKLDVDIDELDKQNADMYIIRATVNKEIKQLEGEVEGITIPPNPPTQEQDISALLTEMEEAAQFNTSLSGEIQHRNNLLIALENEKNELFMAELRVKKLKKKVQEIELNLPPESTESPMDLSEIKGKIEMAQSRNRIHQLVVKRRTLTNLLDSKKAKSAYYTGQMESRTEQKLQAIASAKMPVPGLGFGEGEVLFNSLPLEQASDAERLKISVGIAMAANPTLRVLRIKDGSLLDSTNLQLLAEMAELQDFQIWIEICDESGKAGIVMEDGMVVGA